MVPRMIRLEDGDDHHGRIQPKHTMYWTVHTERSLESVRPSREPLDTVLKCIFLQSTSDKACQGSSVCQLLGLRTTEHISHMLYW